MFIGDNIKKRRFELRMSQQELADAMGYKTRSTIAKIESGKNDVSQRKLLKFAKVLDITAEALVSGYACGIPEAQQNDPDSGRNRNAVIILAGGKSGRNKQNIPSQFINVHGKPILLFSMEAYQRHPAVDDIYVVCLTGWENIVKAYANQYGITKLRGVIRGGNSGITSLKRAIDAIKDRYAPEDRIIIQEATRPMVHQDMISALLRTCAEKGSATICHSMSDYVQFRVSDAQVEYVDRNAVVALQSPEVHRLSLICELFQKAKMQEHPLTESCCTMLLYNMGYEINFVQSSVNNIKITREEDIAAFSALVSR